MVTATLAATVAAGTPILFAAVGEIVTELSGILNLGVEGMMLVGALAGFAVSYSGAGPWWGLAAGAAAGALLGLLHALLSVHLRVNQIVSGLALTILGTGVTGIFGKRFVGQTPPSFDSWAIPILSDLPVAGAVLFDHPAPVYLSYLIVPAVWWVVRRSRWGLSLKAVGEDPGVADAMGLPVARIRILATLFGGALAGLGGACITLAYSRMWLEGIVAGRGWIAIALVIFAFWDPLKAAAGAWVFGGINALQLRLQATGSHIPPSFLLMLPYLVTIGVLVVIAMGKGRLSGAPSSLGLPYYREDR
jgi:simple sugar transport system permease protein